MWGAIAGAVVGGLMAAKGQKDANETSARQAAENREFQERMSNTAHQREVADLRAAGLNPILSGTGGAGASSPAGSFATAQNELAPAVSTALEVRRNKAEVDQLEANTFKTKQDVYTSKAAEVRDLAASDYLRQQTKTEEHATEQAKHAASIASNSAKGANIEGEIDSTTWGKVLRYINRANPLGNSASNIGNMLKR